MDGEERGEEVKREFKQNEFMKQGKRVIARKRERKIENETQILLLVVVVVIVCGMVQAGRDLVHGMCVQCMCTCANDLVPSQTYT